MFFPLTSAHSTSWQPAEKIRSVFWLVFIRKSHQVEGVELENGKRCKHKGSTDPEKRLSLFDGQSAGAVSAWGDSRGGAQGLDAGEILGAGARRNHSAGMARVAVRGHAAFAAAERHDEPHGRTAASTQIAAGDERTAVRGDADSPEPAGAGLPAQRALRCRCPYTRSA